MFGNKKLLFVPLLAVMLVYFQCSSLGLRETFYTDAENGLLEKTLNALDYGYGYDFEMEMNYIYSYSYSKDKSDKKEKSFSDIMDTSDFGTIVRLYEKILKLQAITDYKTNRYQKEQKWNYYTFIKNNLSEPLNNYSYLMQKYILKKSPSLEQILTMKKESVGFEVKNEYESKDEISDIF